MQLDFDANGRGRLLTAAMLGEGRAVLSHFIRILAAASSAGILAASAQPIISTYAGGPPVNGPALSVSLPLVNDVKADAAGNLYICLLQRHVVYKMDTSGYLTVIAGTGVNGHSGDNGPGTNARLSVPSAIALDKLGNLYIAEYNRVRKLVLATGIISTVAGNGVGSACYPQCNDDGQPATSVWVYPTTVAVDNANDVYIGETGRIRKIIGTTITTVAGTGFSGSTGDGGPATQATVQPNAIAFDSSNNMFIADSWNSVVRKISGGIISTITGDLFTPYSGDGGPAVNARVLSPAGLVCDNMGNLYVSEGSGQRVRKISGGIISSLNFSGHPGALTIDPAGKVVVADNQSNVIWKIESPVQVVIAGNGAFNFNGDNLPAIGAAILPWGSSIALDKEGSLYFPEMLNYRVRRVTPGGIVTTFAGTGRDGTAGDNGPATSADLRFCLAVAIDGSGRIYIGEVHRIRVVDKSGIISTLANDVDLPAVMAVDRDGTVYYTSSSHIRKIRNGIVTDVLAIGPATQPPTTCNTGPAASVVISADDLRSLAVDPKGILYFAGATCIRRLKNGMVERVAGGYQIGFSGDGGPATSALFASPTGMAFDVAGRLYVADGSNARVRSIINGIVNTVAGQHPIDGSYFASNFSGDGGPAANASLDSPTAVIPDSHGNLFIADGGNFRIRKVSHLYKQVARDFDGTERSSLLLYNVASGTAYIALSNGDGTYQYPSAMFTPGFDILRTGDFSGDGRTDLVLYNSHTSLAYIGMSNGDGTFAFQSVFWSPGYDFVEPGDLNGDGETDFALYNSSTGTLYTGISNGTGGFTYKYTLISKGFTFARLADFTGDGKAGILVYNKANGSAYIGIGDGTGGFVFHPLFLSAGYDLADIGDLNGDGKADLILYSSATGNAATGISDGAGSFAFTPMPFSPGFTSVRLADHTGDGKADVTVYNKNTAAAYFGTGTGTGTFNFQSLFWSPGYDYVEPQDVNGDGKLDIVLYNSATGTEYTGLSNGDGTFAYTYQYWGIGRMLAR